MLVILALNTAECTKKIQMKSTMNYENVICTDHIGSQYSRIHVKTLMKFCQRQVIQTCLLYFEFI